MVERTSEADMAQIVHRILFRMPGQKATFEQIREQVPKLAHLTKGDHRKSRSRPREEVWMQITRNLVAHKHEGFVPVKSGLRLQWRGQHRMAA
jgi:hypothetical protein